MLLWPDARAPHEGALLRLVYDDYPNGVSVEPKDNVGQKAVDFLFQLVKSHSDESGL